MKKAALHNLGCKVNAYETEAMEQMLEQAGYEIVPFAPGADVYVINTCSVTNIADRKSRQMLHKAKKMNPDAAVVAVGCYVQAAGKELIKDEAIDLVIGNDRKNELIHILEEHFSAQKDADIIEIGNSREYEELHIDKISDHTRAFIKVQDGCNQFCSYCIIPYTRGRVRSRRPESVESEIRGLAHKGYEEIVLTGIHLSSYGTDFPKEEQVSLLQLIQQLHNIEEIKRIRLGSLEPRIVTEEFARALSDMEKICPHFHLSLQSGCDSVLKRMNRRYTTEEYLEGCRILRKYFSHPAITTDVIVGFPGETEEEFETTKRFLETVHFYEMHVFKYSRRKGTRADQMEGQVAESVKAARSDKLLKLEKKMSEEFRKDYIGRELEILLEEEKELDNRKYFVGHTKEYVKAAIPKEQFKTRGFVKGKAVKMITDDILLLEV